MRISYLHSIMRTPPWFRLMFLGLAMLAGGFVSIQAHAPAQVQAGRGEHTIYVSALGDKSEPVRDLPADAFVVREDGIPREVLRVARATDPIDIALLVDNSTAADLLIPRLRPALPPFIAALTPANHIAVITLASRPTIAIDYTSNAARLDAAVNYLFALPETGMTLLDAIAETSEGLAKRSGTRAAIVAVVTDGPEFTNRYARDVIGAIKKVGAAFYPITIGRFDLSQEHDPRQRLMLLADGPRQTGGRRITLLTAISVSSALEDVARDLTSQYAVVYSRPESLIPPRTIEVASARDGVTMRGTPARTP